ncbi:unnamed protein product, partial [Effrenium voratum]
RHGQPREQESEEEAEEEIDSATSRWVTEAVAHARELMKERPRGAPEAASLLSSVLLRVPALWAELSQETLMAFASGDISGDRSHSGGSAFVPKNADLAAKTRRLLLASVAAVIAEKPPMASVALLCLLGEAEADEGRFIAAFQTLRRAQALARQSNTNGDRAEAALQGLRAAALQRWHFQMINDVPRGEQYGRAIEMAVAELLPQAPTGLLALDIGAGTGLLSLMCARLKGVREVHACEMNDALCAVAREVIAASQSCCPVTVHPVVSTSLQPREKFDLIFCEVFDAGLLGEHALPTLLHAKKALLKEGGILVPARATLFGQVVEAPGLLDRFSVRSPTGAALAGARLQNSERYTCETMWAVPHKKLTEAAKLVTLDFHQIEYLYSNLGNWIDPPIELSVCRTGEAHAFVFWWELELDAHGRCRIHTAPEGGSESWQQAVQPMAKAKLQEGQKVQLHLRLQADGMEVALQEASGQIASIEPTDVPELQLEEEELLRFNDAKHWQMVQTALQAAFQRLEKRSVQLVDISESLPLALLQSASSDSCVAGVRGNTEKEVMKALLAAHSIDNEKVFLLVASPQQVIQAALPVPYPLKEDGQSIASIVLCEDVVAASGALRSEALEDLALLWRSCAGKLQREVLVVPEAITLKLALIQSHELERRTRVVERPGGVDVSSVNALSVPEFLGLEESLLQLQWLSAEVEALTLPLGEPLLTALAALSATGDNGQPLLRVKLVASCAGKVHGIATKFSWAGASEPGHQLAGVTWPGLPPELEAGDAVFASVRYSPCRGLVAADSAADAESQ